MDPAETMIQSFVIKIWLEEMQAETGRTLWRGHITHIPSKRRVYLEELDDIIHFIVPYLKQMEVEIGEEWL